MASDLNGNQWLQPIAGLNNVGSYQVSGIPWATGSLVVSDTQTTELLFPNVTKFVVIKNLTTTNLKVGFSANGLENKGNYFVLGNKESFAGDLRLSRLYLRGDSAPTTVSIVAGLTGIPAGSLPTNWSGSFGVG